MALGQFLTVVAVNHRDVGVNRHRRIQRFQDVNLARGIVDMVFAANNVGDFHIPVVNHDAEVIGWRTIGTADNQIVQLLVAEFDRTADLVIKNNGTLFRVGKTDDARFVISMMFVAMAAATVVAGLLAFCHLLFTQRFQTLF